jgi:hypothetical protein
MTPEQREEDAIELIAVYASSRGGRGHVQRKVACAEPYIFLKLGGAGTFDFSRPNRVTRTAQHTARAR